MKRFSILTGALFLGLTLFSCIDDVKEPEPGSETGDISQLSGMFDMKIIDIDEKTPRSFDWKLLNKNDITVSVTAKHDGSDPFNFRIETDKEGYKHLVCDNIDFSKIDLSRPRIFNLKMSLANSSVSKEIKVVLRNSEEEISVDDQYYFASRAIGWSMDVTQDFGAYRRIIAFSTLDRSDKTGDIELNDGVQGGDSFESGGKRYNDIKTDYSVNVGLKGQKKLKNGMLSGSLNGGVNESNEYVENYEYYIAAIRQEMATAVLLNRMMLDPDELQAHMSSYICEILNDSTSSGYQQYANDEEGIKALYAAWGTHVITRGTFGGLYTIKYSRMENIHAHDIGIDVSASIKGSGSSSQTPGSGNSGTTGNAGLSNFFNALTKKMTSSYLSADADLSYGESSYQDAIKAQRQISSSGRNGTQDLDEWMAGNDDRKTWVLTRYELPMAINNSDTTNLIPLYDFVVNKTSARYKAMVEYLPTYIEERTPKPISRELVLADFMMYVDPYAPGGHKDGSYPKPFGRKKTFNNDQDLLYVPIYMNYNGPYNDQKGYALDTDQDKFCDVDGNKPHYWYVAYGFKDTDYNDNKIDGVFPLVDVRLAKASEMGKDESDKGGEDLRWYEQRGSSATESTVSSMKENYVYVRLFNPKSDDNRLPITAIGLCKNKEESDKWSDITYATTYGAEWKNSWSYFEDEWSTFWDSDSTKCSNIKEGFYEGGMIRTSWDVHVIYSTKSLLYPLNQNLSWGESINENGTPVPNRNGNNVIQMYRKWGE